MGVDVAVLGMEVDTAQIKQAIIALGQLQAASKKSEDAVNQHGAAVSRIEGRLASFGNGINNVRRALEGYIAFLGLRQLAQYSDAWQNINARISIVTKTEQEHAAALQAVYDISQLTRTNLDDTAAMYTKLAPLGSQLGKSQSEMLRTIQTVQEALLISGANAQEASSAILQFSQAIGSGKLAGDELRSITENGQRLARAIAEGMSDASKGIRVTVGDLRVLGAQGKLTSEVVLEALSKSAGTIDSEFAKVPITIAGSFTQLNNAIERYVGQAAQSTGASHDLAAGVSFIAANFDRLADTVLRFAEFLAVTFIPLVGESLVLALNAAAAATVRLTLSMLRNPLILLLTGIAAVVAWWVTYADRVQVASDATATFTDYTVAAWDRVKSAFEMAVNFISAQWDALVSRAENIINNISDFFTALAESLKAPFDSAMDKIKEFFDTAKSYIPMQAEISSAADIAWTLIKSKIGIVTDETMKATDEFNKYVTANSGVGEKIGESWAEAAQKIADARKDWESVVGTVGGLNNEQNPLDRKPIAQPSTLGGKVQKTTQAEKAAWDDVTKLVAGYENKWKGVIDKVSEHATDKLTHALVDPWKKGESAADRFRNVAVDILREIAYEVMKQAVIAPFVKAIGGAISGGFSGGTGTQVATSSHGNVFEGGRIIPHAQGGIISQASAFPMSGGNIGTVAEGNKPEAIMPLKRDTAGNLGVSVSGGGGGVSVVNNVSVVVQSNGSESGDEQGDAIAKKVDEMLNKKMSVFLAKQMKPNGMLNQGVNA